MSLSPPRNDRPSCIVQGTRLTGRKDDAMTTDSKFQAALGLHRFGFGPAPGSIGAIADDPRGAMLADLERSNAGLVAAPGLPSSAAAARTFFEYRATQLAERKLAQRKQAGGSTVDGPASDKVMKANANAQISVELPERDQANQDANVGVRLLEDEARVRIDAAVSAQIGFTERLVWFWSNHFCVSTDKLISMAGAYEREAIRPHVLGRFVDMLIAVESHPAMLLYLDNAESMGPNSVAGINRDRGLDENLAREALELHTLGVRSGYSQADVTNFAKVLTGWTLIYTGVVGHGGEFVFAERMHEPGAQIVLGKRYPEDAMEQGLTVLADLARHPATARHIATKLAVHFVADEPPPSLVEKLARTFSDSDGDLKETAKTLITAEESWTPVRSKLKRPSEWHIGALRLTGSRGNARRFLRGQALLGEPVWRPPAPNGFSDDQAAWIDGLPRRADIASSFASRVADRLDPVALIDEGLGQLTSVDTRGAIARGGSRAQALALLLMSPEFLRR
jgi:uncharacterized protein (DUF1800 family)